MYELTRECQDDAPAIETLLDLAFGAERKRKISYRYRQGVQPLEAFSMVARAAGGLCGTIRYWPVRIEQALEAPALLLGPVAVDPALRGQGVGRALIHATLARVRADGSSLVFLVGDLSYYRQFGFAPVPPPICMPDEDPARLQWLGLRGARLPQHGGRLLRDTSDGLLLRRRGAGIEPGQEQRPDLKQVLVPEVPLGHLA